MIRLASAADTPALAKMLARSFAQEEFSQWLMGQHAGQEQRLERAFAIQLQHFALPHQHVWCGKQYEAAALWSPPNVWRLGLQQQVQLLPEVIQLAGFKHLGRLWQLNRVAKIVQAAHPKMPHYYLQLLGVDPAQQGQGWSRTLMNITLQQADSKGLPCYLKTSTLPLVPLYRRFGFEVIHTLDDLPYGAPTLWGMWREPQIC